MFITQCSGTLWFVKYMKKYWCQCMPLYRNESSNYWNPPPLYPGKLLIKHLNTHVWSYYSNIRTPTPCGARTAVAECLLAFDILCGARVRVTKHLLAYYRHLRPSTRLLLSLWSSNGGCQKCTSLQQCLRSLNGGCQKCTSLQQSLQRSNRG